MIPPMFEGRLSEWMERAWLTRYLDRQLSEAEAAWFEAYVLDKDELLAAIEADTDLRDALGSATQVSNVESVVTNAPRQAWAHRSVRRFAWMGIAAALIAGIGLGQWSNVRREPDAIPNPSRVVFDTFRGEETLRSGDPTRGTSPYLIVEVAVPAAASDVKLQIEGQPDIAMEPSSEGFVSALIGRPLLAARRAIKVSYTIGDETRTMKLDLNDGTGGQQ
jgi:hypothetical protein